MSGPDVATDYLVVGAGAAAMAFVDTLLDETNADIVMVDRRAAPGGHWNDAYPFVRLHQPSAYYGVNSAPLGSEEIQAAGPEAGMYGRATGAELCAYYARVMRERLLASGRVRFFPACAYLADRGLVARAGGPAAPVTVRRRVVDATYLAPAVPAVTPPPFAVADAVSCIPVGRLADVTPPPERYVIVGAGKTAMDACIFLLEGGVAPGRIRWIKPRESWLVNRRFSQPRALVGTLLEGFALSLEAAAAATSLDDLFARLEEAEQLRRVDAAVTPTMYKVATIADWELALLRQIDDVVRLGHVQRIERDRIVLERGEVATTPGTLHVHCAADGLPRPPALPIFAPRRITLQPVRTGLVPFNAALVAFVEAHRDDDVEKNRLCPPNPFPDAPADWARALLIQLQADHAWSREPDIADWLERSRLNPTQGVRARAAADPRVQQAARRFAASVRGAVARLAALTAAQR